jgi:hypothetical protein
MAKYKQKVVIKNLEVILTKGGNLKGTIRNKDGKQVILHRRRESEGRFHLFKSSWNNLKHEPFTLGLSMQNDSKLRKNTTQSEQKEREAKSTPLTHTCIYITTCSLS